MDIIWYSCFALSIGVLLGYVWSQIVADGIHVENHSLRATLKLVKTYCDAQTTVDAQTARDRIRRLVEHH